MRIRPSHAATAIAAALLLGASPFAQAELASYRFDPVHTQVVLFADHLGLSHGIGRAKVGSGWLRFDADDWSTAQLDVSVDLTTLDMGEVKWTRTVQSSQFLDVKRYPTARFVSHSVEKTGPTIGTVAGELSLHGKTRPVTMQLKFNRIGRDPYAFKTKAGFSARMTIDRFDFGIDRYREVVGAEVEMRIEVEAILDPKAASGEPTDGAQEY
ncbi:MAG: YceI family protein [Dokdonella sp.]